MAGKPRTKKAKQAKVNKVLHEYKRGKLHSGSKHGPKVRSRKQAIAIALHQSGSSVRTKARRKKK